MAKHLEGEAEDSTWFLPLVINLSHRKDRIESATAEALKFQCRLIRIDAIDANDISEVPDYVTKGALACWNSHKLAMHYLIESPYDFALIFEDDFNISSEDKFRQLINRPGLFINVDIFQFGYLINDYKERLDLLFRNIENFLFSILGRINLQIFGKQVSFSSRLRVRRKLHLPLNWVADDFRAGAHAYLISKSAARRILELNQPTFLTTDAFFSSLNSGRAFRVYRHTNSLIGQIVSPSSIKNWGAEVTNWRKE
jgi:GR25 family glycosyltransferase involved in LPS biosynthesis